MNIEYIDYYQNFIRISVIKINRLKPSLNNTSDEVLVHLEEVPCFNVTLGVEDKLREVV